jgi:indolepyruvate ferredoxin oxidoreductase alpha subunit
MIVEAFAHSEKYGEPVLFRPTTRVCHSCASVEILENLPKIKPGGFIKDPGWVIFPRLSYTNKFKIEENLKNMSEEFSGYSMNILKGSGRKGIATGGVSYTFVQEALHQQEIKDSEHKLLKISAYPFPDKLGLKFMEGLDEVLVIEELDPVIENELVRLCGLHQINLKILGKRSGHIQIAGENTADTVANAIAKFLDTNAAKNNAAVQSTAPVLPVRPPVMCAGCSHRAAFFAVKEAAKGKKAVFTGDIGCYTLGNAAPLNMVDTCLCMGASISVAQGLKRAEPDTIHFAFIGDSTFFHTGIPGVVNAVYNQTDIIIVVLDNATTAMTGNQPHPGMGITMMNTRPPKISIEKIMNGIGVSALIKVNPFDLKAAKEAAVDLMEQKGVRVLLYEAPCIMIEKPNGKTTIDSSKCNGCKLCLNKFGCPAISFTDGKAVLNTALCVGCGVCVELCPTSAIKCEVTNDV